jgi:phosphoribosyl-ATP pyrophosphohydrolase/phosphoribosyl-AMP cyclohydrolase
MFGAMEGLKFDDRGLIHAVVQDRLTGEVRMCAFMNREALARTLSTGRATFYSRSRATIWEKGESSGNTMRVVSIHADCDADTLLLLVDPAGPSCHTGLPNCFFRHVSPEGVRDTGVPTSAFLQRLEGEIAARRASSSQQSYTKSLLEAGVAKIGDKLREEADELARALAAEDDGRVASEAADVVYHLMVGLAARNIPLRAVLAALADRSGKSGHAEKASRAPKPN